ncbi:hypothetical protein PCK1_001488 [Pneumocystis canis]|nr:hypothetical protein PCK1_001488 [Pneumocystis canis]
MSMVFMPLTEPTAVEHALAARFTSCDENLIIGRFNRLQIYGLLKEKRDATVYYHTPDIEKNASNVYVREHHENFLGSDVKLEPSRLETVSSLFLIYETQLYG